MSTTVTLAFGDRILPIKSVIDGIGWKEQYRKQSEGFINIIYTTTAHAYSSSKFIFLCALQDGVRFDIASYVNKKFFSKV
ncbi:hypothetical protein RO3G_10505 [Rhizopus delemar RA 99-880]|uniref:Uncharacterized protein n=1 Tax=Rhizopus delemar (strain RA 99-880 / ATCC MYA-4621 / FGSC 9543 / NRRL 43880) TaxID=246409 RepID=I1CBG5_RHIO9|nr:hypothetical protein RO3G_10505 [Rhizopus delemar RA 99-880]|eukprot:EIE85795.1 hypothetical protein RO3G_10505 [Rhizopus delemar RA 99-880]